ncbi:MAG: hypothetical protein M3R02_11960 [Chloroflexota bacterium]|nr:hypothetical protein [Chloroflexota bacterium]
MAQPIYQINLRIEPPLHAAIEDEAERRFRGSRTGMVKEATRFWLRLRERHGARFDEVVRELLGDEQEATS